MKLVRFGDPGRERPGIWLEHGGEAMILDVRSTAFDIVDYDSFFFSRFGLERLSALTREHKRKLIPAASVRLGAPVARPGKIICVGKNYLDHAKEFDSVIPKSPVLFSKASTSLNGPFDPIYIEAGRVSTDAEVELAIVIGRRARNIDEADAAGCIAGSSVVNDVTDREAQKEGQQWFRGKSFDSFCPMGPWLVTIDEFDPTSSTALRSHLNDAPLQNGNTGDMMFGVAHLVSFISRSMTLEPGDVIATGTPSGVGFARTPPVLLRDGDTIACEVEGIGSIRNRVMAR